MYVDCKREGLVFGLLEYGVDAWAIDRVGKHISEVGDVGECANRGAALGTRDRHGSEVGSG